MRAPGWRWRCAWLRPRRCARRTRCPSSSRPTTSRWPCWSWPRWGRRTSCSTSAPATGASSSWRRGASARAGWAWRSCPSWWSAAAATPPRPAWPSAPRFVEQDLFKTDLSVATVITMYLLQEVNLQLRPALLALQPGTRIVSHDWDLGDWRPDRSLTRGRARQAGGPGQAQPAAPVGGAGAGRRRLVRHRRERGARLQLVQSYQVFDATLAVGGAAQLLAGRIDGPRLRSAGGFEAALDGARLRVTQAGDAPAALAGRRVRTLRRLARAVQLGAVQPLVAVGRGRQVGGKARVGLAIRTRPARALPAPPAPGSCAARRRRGDPARRRARHSAMKTAGRKARTAGYGRADTRRDLQMDGGHDVLLSTLGGRGLRGTAAFGRGGAQLAGQHRVTQRAAIGQHFQFPCGTQLADSGAGVPGLDGKTRHLGARVAAWCAAASGAFGKFLIAVISDSSPRLVGVAPATRPMSKNIGLTLILIQ